MSVSAIYVNLPASDLQQARKFWSRLGFSFNEQFSDEKAICLVLKENTIYAMLISHEQFYAFAQRPIASPQSTQVLLAIEVESRERVDEIVTAALAQGGSRYREAADHGWMYYDCFADPDGHQWEIMFTDVALLAAQSSAAITVEAIVEARVEAVWEKWTSPDHIVNWNFASDDWHCPAATNDLRAGGRFSSTMASRDGSMSFDFEGTYESVAPLSSIAYVMDDGRKVSISFEDLGNRTHVRETFDPEQMNPAELQQAGWQAILNQFKSYTEGQ